MWVANHKNYCVMKSMKDEALACVPTDSVPAKLEDLESKGLFSQNILLKGDVLELPDEYNESFFRLGREFKTRIKDPETGEIKDGVTRPVLIFVKRNGVPAWMPLGNFLRGNRVHNAAEYREAAANYPLNIEMLRAQNQAEVAKLLCTGKTIEVADTFDGKFAHFEKNVLVEGVFDIKKIPLFAEK